MLHTILDESQTNRSYCWAKEYMKCVNRHSFACQLQIFSSFIAFLAPVDGMFSSIFLDRNKYRMKILECKSSVDILILILNGSKT